VLASRRAWWVRCMLAVALSLLLLPLAWWFHPMWMLLSLLGFIYPTNYQEKAALNQIDHRYGLAYRSALEAITHPWRTELEAASRRSLRQARLPVFPWFGFLLWALVMGVGLVQPSLL
jgi:hypothetical protein